MHADDAHKLAEQHFATLVAALEAGRSDALVRYLETASRVHTYSLLFDPQHRMLNVFSQTM
jgi:hypothetical protein